MNLKTIRIGSKAQPVIPGKQSATRNPQSRLEALLDYGFCTGVQPRNDALKIFEFSVVNWILK